MTINAGRSPDTAPVDYRWWDESEQKVAGAMAAVGANIERWAYPRRYLNLTCTRYMTGREMSNLYAYGMARRPAQLARAYSLAEWKPPSFNVIATCADVYSTRLWSNRPFITVIPIAGNFKARVRSRKLARYADAVFSECGLWNLAAEAGIDCMTTGDGFIKVHESVDGNHISMTRVMSDEMLINEEESSTGAPLSMIQRVFMHKEHAIYRYGDTPEKRQAIEEAPGVYAGLYFGNGLNTSDVIPLVQGWHLPHPSGGQSKKDAGRVTISVADVLLDDDVRWERQRFPFAKVAFSLMPTNSFFKQGLAEILLPIQVEVDRNDQATWEAMRRGAWNRWRVDRNSQVNPGDLAGRSSGIINWTSGGSNQPPDPINVQVMHPEVYQKRQQWLADAFQRARINPAGASGEMPEGLKSGAAIMAWATVDDAAHKDLGQRQEDWITDIANLVFDLAEDIKPTVRLPGRRVQQIDWDDVRMSRSDYAARAFPMSRLPQLPAARLQTIQNWYDQGIIDKGTKMRLEQVPDTEGYMDLANASRDDVEMVLDRIIEDAEYLPPEPYQDLQLALTIAQSRYLQERTQDTPPDRLRLLQQWIMQCADIIGQTSPGPVGIQSPAGLPAIPGSQQPPAAPPQGGGPMQMQEAA